MNKKYEVVSRPTMVDRHNVAVMDTSLEYGLPVCESHYKENAEKIAALLNEESTKVAELTQQLAEANALILYYSTMEAVTCHDCKCFLEGGEPHLTSCKYSAAEQRAWATAIKDAT